MKVQTTLPERISRTKQALINAGIELLSEFPIDALSIDEIVQVAGVGKGSFFNHFGDKSNFALEIAAAIRSEVEARASFHNREVEDPAARVARGVSQFVAFAIKDPKRAAILCGGREWAIIKDHPLNRDLRSDLRKGEKEGRFRQGASEEGILFVLGVCGAVVIDIIERRLSKRVAARSATANITMLLAGLGLSANEASKVAARATNDILKT